MWIYIQDCWSLYSLSPYVCGFKFGWLAILTSACACLWSNTSWRQGTGRLVWFSLLREVKRLCRKLSGSYTELLLPSPVVSLTKDFCDLQWRWLLAATPTVILPGAGKLQSLELWAECIAPFYLRTLRG